MACRRAALLSLFLLVLVLVPATADAAPKCTIRGTAHHDVLRGTPHRDVICGGDGDDVLRGVGGDDVLRGGRGNDTLIGGRDGDVLIGGPGADWLDGGAGDDELADVGSADATPNQAPWRPDLSDDTINAAVDYHPIQLSLWAGHEQNCRAGKLPQSLTCGVGGGSSSSPAVGPWTITWMNAGVGIDVGLEVIIQNRDTGLDLLGHMTGFDSANLSIRSGTAPVLDALTPVLPTPTSSPAPAGEKGGPLSIDIEAAGSGILEQDRYDVTIRGYLAFAKVQQGIDFQGVLNYGTNGDAATQHDFHAGLVIFDTPSHPACNATYPLGTGGCNGTFTRGSTSPFRGAGVSGLHWHNDGTNPMAMQLLAPSATDPKAIGGNLTGFSDGTPNLFGVVSGAAPEWNATTAITTGRRGLLGQTDGPLKVDLRGPHG